MVKRTRDIFDCDSPTPPSPTKRLARQSQSSPIRPRASSAFSTPFAYTVRTPLSVPQDSPTNPFGLKRTLTALELPRSTVFGKHICLRFQLVDTRPGRTLAAKRRDREGGVYRVVQVPLNYTFRHLHKLILFLFASDINEFHSQLPSGRRTSLRSSSTGTAQAKGKARAGHNTSSSQWGGHFFEVLKPASVHSNATKPGVIKAGATVRAKLSSVRERRLFRDLLDPENAAGSSSDLPKTLEDEDVEKENWTWEAEDDFTLGKVWYRGPSVDRGIAYRHQPDISIHITANTLSVPQRKGSGNTPYVFSAQGTAGGLVRLAHVVPTEDGGEGVFPLPDSDLEHLLHPLTKVHIDRWNQTDAFPKFLWREAQRERTLQRAPPSPPRASLSSSPERAPVARPREHSEAPTTVPSSDPMFPSSEPESETSDLSTYSAYSDSAIFPFAFSAITPYPSHPLHRKRMQRAERRMARLTKSGLGDMLSSDEEDAKKKKKGKEKGKEEGKGKGKRPAEDVASDGDEEEHIEGVKENIEAPVVVQPKTYAKRIPRAQQTGKERGTMRRRKPPPVMDVIEWTPAPEDEGDQYAREWGSVEV